MSTLVYKSVPDVTKYTALRHEIWWIGHELKNQKQNQGIKFKDSSTKNHFKYNNWTFIEYIRLIISQNC